MFIDKKPFYLLHHLFNNFQNFICFLPQTSIVSKASLVIVFGVLFLVHCQSQDFTDPICEPEENLMISD